MALVEHSRAADAVTIALENVEDSSGAREPIILRRKLTGWPILHADSHETWEFARTLPHEWSWLADAFGDAEEFWVAFVAHTMTLNFAEFLWRVQHGPPFEVLRRDGKHAPRIPPYYIDEDADVQRRAFRMFTRDAEAFSPLVTMSFIYARHRSNMPSL
ncbi:MAG: hypothetical protein JWO52_5339 [Gammaproteobacteria bacterium]|nr:hypothetical protein [Gammaproteobacteria bacterium]